MTNLLDILLDRPISFHRALVDIGGSVNAAVLLGQLIFWCRRSDDGWVSKTQEEWHDETGLTRREQETARKLLRDKGILLEKREGLPASLKYNVNWVAIENILQNGGFRQSSDERFPPNNPLPLSDSSSLEVNSQSQKPLSPIVPSPLFENMVADVDLEPGEEWCEIWSQYLDLRRKRKWSVKEDWQRGQLKWLREQDDPYGCIEHSLRNGYQGLFPRTRNRSGTDSRPITKIAQSILDEMKDQP